MGQELAMLRRRTSGLQGSVCEKRRVRDGSLEITAVKVKVSFHRIWRVCDSGSTEDRDALLRVGGTYVADMG